MNAKIWLSSPHMGGNELKYVHEAFDQNWVVAPSENQLIIHYRSCLIVI